MKQIVNRITVLALFGLWMGSTAAAETAADETQVDEPYARAVPAVMDNSAMFMTLRNTGSREHALVRAGSDAAKVVELHTHINDNGVMRMRPVPKIDIGAGGATVLKPGGLHVMLIGLQRPLEVGDTVNVDLEFEDGSRKAVVAEVRPVRRMQQHGGQ
jgi:copper(I)-binding protein